MLMLLPPEQVLDLRENMITGPLVESMGSLKNLKHLHLQGNRLEGVLPPGALQGWHALQTLEMQVTSPLPHTHVIMPLQREHSGHLLLPLTMRHLHVMIPSAIFPSFLGSVTLSSSQWCANNPPPLSPWRRSAGEPAVRLDARADRRHGRAAAAQPLPPE